jgi:small subunit ribosomal protein S21
MRVDVRNNNIERALKVMKRKLSDDGMFKELQQRQFYEKPSEKRKRKMRQAVSRQAKADRERMELLNG